MYTELARELIYMKHEVTTMNTKKTLAASLKKFMGEETPFKGNGERDSDGLRSEPQDLLLITLKTYMPWLCGLWRRGHEVVKKFDLMVDYEEAILFVMTTSTPTST